MAYFSVKNTEIGTTQPRSNVEEYTVSITTTTVANAVFAAAFAWEEDFVSEPVVVNSRVVAASTPAVNVAVEVDTQTCTVYVKNLAAGACIDGTTKAYVVVQGCKAGPTS